MLPRVPDLRSSVPPMTGQAAPAHPSITDDCLGAGHLLAFVACVFLVDFFFVVFTMI